ncbi:MAG: hypothetical protein HY614_02820 [Candidatus Rokubacteria bacterium]|nr:hypothetical protein [Candidatus Rokubacteria bacterium]
MAIDATDIYCAHPEDFEGDMRTMVMARNCPLHYGDPEPSQALAARIERELGWQVTVPGYRDRVSIE